MSTFDIQMNKTKMDIFKKIHKMRLWKFPKLSRNSALTWDMARHTLNEPWNWHDLSANPCVTTCIVKATMHKLPWSFYAFSNNPNLTIDFIKEIGPHRFEWFYVSRNSAITWTDVLKNPEFPWNYNGLSMNANITEDIVRHNPDRPWVFPYLSRNPHITFHFMQQNLDKEWDIFYVSKNKNISLEQLFKLQSDFKAHFNKRFNRMICWHYVSQNERTTREIISSPSYHDMPWDWQELSRHKHFDIAYMMKNNHLPWDMRYMCLNPNVTYNHVFGPTQEEKIVWDWDYLSQNPGIFQVEAQCEQINSPSAFHIA